jgi:hypothetical protein
LRYQPITVSGLTTASAERQSPQFRERNPHNKPGGWGQARSFVGVLNDTDLVSAGEDLQLHGGTGSEHASESSEQWPNERHLLVIGEAGNPNHLRQIEI